MLAVEVLFKSSFKEKKKKTKTGKLYSENQNLKTIDTAECLDMRLEYYRYISVTTGFITPVRILLMSSPLSALIGGREKSGLGLGIVVELLHFPEHICHVAQFAPFVLM